MAQRYADTNMVNTGLVGYGFGGSVFHAPLIRSVPQLRLSAVVTSRREQVERDLPWVRVVATIEDLVSDPAIQLVVVSTPTPTHFDVARAALEAGKHVVVDKPFTTSIDEADTLIDVARTKRVLLSVYQNRRWDNDFLTVQQCVRDNWLDTVYYYEARFDRFRPQIKPGWREESETGSGILYDLGAHLIDQAIVLFGMPEAVTADAFAQRPGARAIDYFHLVLEYGRMRAILHSTTLAAGAGPHFVIHGDAGSFIKYGMDSQETALMAGKRPGDPEWGLDDPANYGELTLADGSRRSIDTQRGCYERYYEMMAAAIEQGGPVPVDSSDSRNGLAVIEAALRSASERQTIAIDRT